MPVLVPTWLQDQSLKAAPFSFLLFLACIRHDYGTMTAATHARDTGKLSSTQGSDRRDSQAKKPMWCGGPRRSRQWTTGVQDSGFNGNQAVAACLELSSRRVEIERCRILKIAEYNPLWYVSSLNNSLSEIERCRILKIA